VIPKNGGTRPPARWDRHLHEKFILRKVVSAPDLTSRLGEIADSALERAQANLLNHSKPDQLFEKMKSLGAACIKNTNCESEVRDFYKESIAPLCLATAGALSFGTAGDFLKWQSERYRQTQAKADGFLVVAGHGSDFFALPDEYKTRIKLLEEWHLNVLAIWEFKSLAAGSKDTMDAILELSSQENFPWTGCTPDDPCKSAEYHQSDSRLPHNTGRRTGPDSSSPLIDSQPKVAKCSPDVITGSTDTADHLSDVEDEVGDETISCDDEDIFSEDEKLEDEAHTKGSQVKSKHIIQQVGFTTVSMLHTMLIIYLQGLGRSSTK